MLPPKFLPRIKRSIAYAGRNVIEAAIGFSFYGGRIPMDPNLFVVLKKSANSD